MKVNAALVVWALCLIASILILGIGILFNLILGV